MSVMSSVIPESSAPFKCRKGAGESLNIKGAYFEVLSDMLTSIGVIVAAIIIMKTGWTYADPLISAGIGLFILPRTWLLLREAVGVPPGGHAVRCQCHRFARSDRHTV